MENQFVSEQNRFAIISGLILLVGCLGGLTVGMGAINNVFTLMLVVFPTMTTLSLLLAVAPMVWIARVALATVFVDAVSLVYFLL